MSKLHPICLLAVLAFVLPTQASAALTPTFAASTDPGGTTSITYSQSGADDPAQALTFFVPSAIFGTFSYPDGAAIGTASAKATDSTGAAVSLSGSVKAALGTDTISFGGTTTTVAASSQACTGAGAGAGYLVLDLAGSGQAFQVPVFVNNILLDQPFGDSFGLSLAICLPTPDRAKFSHLAFAVSDVFSASPGWNVWHLTAVPYSVQTGKPNSAGAVEAESQDRVPQGVTFHAKKGKAAGVVTVTGKVSDGGNGLAGWTVVLIAGKSKVGTAKTTSGGAFKAVVRTKAKVLVASVTVPTRTLPSCVEPKFSPAACVSATVAGFTAQSDPARVTK